jgi:hypothetical protein
VRAPTDFNTAAGTPAEHGCCCIAQVVMQAATETELVLLPPPQHDKRWVNHTRIDGAKEGVWQPGLPLDLPAPDPDPGPCRVAKQVNQVFAVTRVFDAPTTQQQYFDEVAAPVVRLYTLGPPTHRSLAQPQAGRCWGARRGMCGRAFCTLL